MRRGLLAVALLCGCPTDPDAADTEVDDSDVTDTDTDTDTDSDTDSDTEDPRTEAPTEETDTRVVQRVGSDGVVMELAGARLTIPAGAMPSKTELTFEQTDDAHRRGYAPLSAIFRVSPELVLDAPATLTIFVDEPPSDTTAFFQPHGAPEPRTTGSGPDGEGTTFEITHLGSAFSGHAPYDPYPELPAVPDGSVGVVMALGDLGRTTWTCDGLTWRGERSLDQEGDEDVCDEAASVVCFQAGASCSWADSDGACHVMDTCDCDHHVASPKGLVYWDGAFWMTLGWGKPGSVRTSTDGLAWDVVHEDRTFGSILGTFDGILAPDRYNPQRTSDGGETWQTVTNPPMTLNDGGTDYHVRNAGFATYGSGRAILLGNEDVVLSRDGGDTWEDVDAAAGACVGGRRLAYGNGTIVLGSRTGSVCASADGGETWVVTPLRDDGGSVHVSWDGTSFLVFAQGMRWSSPDGEAWTSEAATLPRFLGEVTAIPGDTVLVGIHEGWQQWYDKQRFYRSGDGGLTWEILDEGDAVRGHRIRHTAPGYLPSSACE